MIEVLSMLACEESQQLLVDMQGEESFHSSKSWAGLRSGLSDDLAKSLRTGISTGIWKDAIQRGGWVVLEDKAPVCIIFPRGSVLEYYIFERETSSSAFVQYVQSTFPVMLKSAGSLLRSEGKPTDSTSALLYDAITDYFTPRQSKGGFTSVA